MSLDSFWQNIRRYLRPWGYLYGKIMQLREKAYFRGLLPCFALPAYVISIGNLTLGGEGKTPLVMALASKIQREGYSVAIISRGYGGRTKGPFIASRGHGPLADPAFLGDETFFMASRLGVPVVIGRDRIAAGVLALKEFNPQVLILDDGFQHLRLARDLDLVLFAADSPYTLKDAVFPAGRLREPVTALKRASAFLITKANLYPKGSAKLAAELMALGRPLFEVPFSIRGIIPLKDWPQRNYVTPHGRALAFCGLAKPESFRRVLKSINIEPVAWRHFPDHHYYQRDDIASLTTLAQTYKTDFFITTEKDAPKLKPFRKALHPCFVLEVGAEIPETLWQFLKEEMTKGTNP